MNDGERAGIESFVNIVLIVLVAVLGFPAVLYFALQRVTGSDIANSVALGTSVVAAVITIYVVYVRES